jgi:hypothetical protein
MDLCVQCQQSSTLTSYGAHAGFVLMIARRSMFAVKDPVPVRSPGADSGAELQILLIMKSVGVEGTVVANG